MRDVNRPKRVVPDAGTCCIALAIGLGTLAAGHLPGAEAAESETADQRRWWMTDQWTVGGEAITWHDGWMYVDGAVAIRGDRGDTARWRLRADHLALQTSPTSARRVVTLHARGRVRLVGPSPLYVAGRRAVSFRPGRTLTVWGEPRSGGAEDRSGTLPRLVGDGWTLNGTQISVDFLDDRATVDTVAAARSPRSRGTGGPGEAIRHRGGPRAAASERVLH